MDNIEELDAYSIAIKTAEMLYPEEQGVLSVLRYIGEDDAVGFIVYSEFGRDEKDLADLIGEEKAKILIDHYYAHCL